MALSTAIFVGESRKWIPELVERAKKLKVTAGEPQDSLFESGRDASPPLPPVWGLIWLDK